MVLQQYKVAPISKGKVLENHVEILKYGEHPTPQNDDLIYNLQKKAQNSILRLSNLQNSIKIQPLESKSFFAHTSQILLFANFIYVTLRFTVAQ